MVYRIWKNLSGWRGIWSRVHHTQCANPFSKGDVAAQSHQTWRAHCERGASRSSPPALWCLLSLRPWLGSGAHVLSKTLAAHHRPPARPRTAPACSWLVFCSAPFFGHILRFLLLRIDPYPPLFRPKLNSPWKHSPPWTITCIADPSARGLLAVLAGSRTILLTHLFCWWLMWAWTWGCRKEVLYSRSVWARNFV